MKINSTFHVFTLLMAVLVFNMPFVAFAQQETPADAIAAAEADADANVNKTLWFAVGCLFTGIGTIAAYVIEPSPPASRLIGKSPEYVAAYTDAYKSKGTNIQGRNALTGCAITIGVYAAFYAIVVVTAVSTDIY